MSRWDTPVTVFAQETVHIAGNDSRVAACGTLGWRRIRRVIDIYAAPRPPHLSRTNAEPTYHGRQGDHNQDEPNSCIQYPAHRKDEHLYAYSGKPQHSRHGHTLTSRDGCVQSPERERPTRHVSSASGTAAEGSGAPASTSVCSSPNSRSSSCNSESLAAIPARKSLIAPASVCAASNMRCASLRPRDSAYSARFCSPMYVWSAWFYALTNMPSASSSIPSWTLPEHRTADSIRR